LSTNLTTKLLIVALLCFAGNTYALSDNFIPQAWDYIFYTFAVCGVVFAGLIIWAYKEYQWLFYVLLSLLLLFHSSVLDGSFAYWLSGHTLVEKSDFIIWLLPFLVTTTVSSYGYLIVGLQLKQPHRLADYKQLFYGLSAIAAAFTFSTVLWLGDISLTSMWLPAMVLFFGMVISQFLAPLTWDSYDAKLRLFIRAYPIIVGVIAVSGYGYLVSSVTTTQNDFNHFYRIILLLVAFFSLGIVVWQAHSNKQSKEHAERAVIESEKSEAEMQLALLKSEQDYNKALEKVAQHRNQLATVSHDLKQPISALRLSVDLLSREQKADSEKLKLAVDYIESLSRSYIDEGQLNHVSSADENEAIPTLMLLNALQTMFEQDALQKGIELRFITRAYTVMVEPLSTMRIMTNIISNAIKHAHASRILVAFRQQGQHVVFQVHDDGRGIADDAQESLFEARNKGNESDGDGLGLAIVKALCDAQKLPFKLHSKVGVGTSIYITMNIYQ